MSGPPGAAGRPPRPAPIRFEPQDPADEYDPLGTGVHSLPTFDHSNPMLAQELPQPKRPITYYGARASAYTSRSYEQQQARALETQRRKAALWRWVGRVSGWVLGLSAVAMVAYASYLAFVSWATYTDPELTPMSSVSPVLALAAGALLVAVLAIGFAWAAVRMLDRRK